MPSSCNSLTSTSPHCALAYAVLAAGYLREADELPDPTVRLPEAIAQAQLAIGEWSPEGGLDAEVSWLVLIAAESENGQTAEARADLQKFLANPAILSQHDGVQTTPQVAANQRLIEGLLRAGMPAE
jgi:hypothetical protein